MLLKRGPWLRAGVAVLAIVTAGAIAVVFAAPSASDPLAAQPALAQSDVGLTVKPGNFCNTDKIHLPPGQTWVCEDRITSMETARDIPIPSGTPVLFDTVGGGRIISLTVNSGFACNFTSGSIRCSTATDLTLTPFATMTVVTKDLLAGPTIFGGFNSSIRIDLPTPMYAESPTGEAGGDVGWD